MRVACPECAAEYDLPPALATRLGEGRTVRCARCGATWAPEPVSAAGARPAEAAPAGPPPSPGLLREEAVFPVGRGEKPPPPAYPSALVLVPSAPAAAAKRPLALLAAAWAASVLLLAGAAAAAWSWRVDLVEAWPPAARAFIALGLAG